MLRRQVFGTSGILSRPGFWNVRVVGTSGFLRRPGFRTSGLLGRPDFRFETSGFL